MFDDKRPHTILWGANGAIGYIQDGVEYGPDKQPRAGAPQGEPEQAEEQEAPEVKAKPKRTRRPKQRT